MTIIDLVILILGFGLGYYISSHFFATGQAA